MEDQKQQQAPHRTPVYRARRILILGCGQLGSALAVMLSDSGSIIRVLDNNSEAFGLLPERRIETARIVPVLGDACSEKDLRRALANESDILLACTGSQTINLMAAQIAKNVIQIPRVLCVLDDLEIAVLFEELGVEYVSSRKIVADQLFEKAMA